MNKILVYILIASLFGCAPNRYRVVTSEPVKFNGEYSNLDLFHPSHFFWHGNGETNRISQ
jgi:hypothetical protein